MLLRTSVDKAIVQAERKEQIGIAAKLRLSKELRAFASQRLSLPRNKSYSSYVDLQRDYPVWLVVAAPKYSLQAKQWCYLVVGCASYRGYFSPAAAQRYADKMSAKGWETYVTGATAYSTLGWFADPLLPTMMRGSDAGFAEVLFHELAHQQLYINGQSDFNEAFASVVGEQGALLWLQEYQPEQVDKYQRRLSAQRDFAGLLTTLKQDLESLYQSGLSDARMSRAKRQTLEKFNERYQRVKAQRWQGQGYYDNWLLTPINNARLAAFSTYHSLQPNLERLFVACNSDFTRFYRHLKNSQDLEQTIECDG